MTLVILLVYALVLTATGLIQRHSGTEAFFFASRRLGSLWIGVTLTASWVGAASTLITLRQATTQGYAALWVMAVPTLITLGVFVCVTGAIRRHHFSTLPRLLQGAYGRRVGGAAGILIFFYMILLTASQLVAWGRLLAATTGLPYTAAVFGGAVLVCAYSMSGGFPSVVRTDGIQLLLLGTALGVMSVLIRGGTGITMARGWDTFIGNAENHALLVFSFTLAWVISPVVWQRVAASRSTASARLGILIAAAMVLILYMLVIPVGMKLGLSAADNRDILMRLRQALPTWGWNLVFLGFGSAILSTADTALNLAAMTITLDFTPSEKRGPLLNARWGTLISAGLAVAAALQLPSILQTLGVASEIMAAGLFIPGMAALMRSKPSPRAGAFSLAAGGGFALLSSLNAYGVSLPLPHWPYSLPWGLGLSLVGFGLGLLWDHLRLKPLSEIE